MVESVEEYSDEYMKQRAIEEGGFRYSTKVCQINPTVNGGFVIGFIVDDSIMCCNFTEEQVAQLISEYPEMCHAIKGEYDGPVIIEAKTMEDGVQFEGVSGTFHPKEPDIATLKFPDFDTDMKPESVLRDIVWRCNGDTPQEVQINVTVEESGNLIVTAEYLGVSGTWKYAEPHSQDEKTEILIEQVGGGDPKMLDGEFAWVVESSFCRDMNKVATTDCGKWALVPNSLYLEWKEKVTPSVISRVRSRFF